MSFNGHVAAITGAGSGIGRALALALAERGCELAIADWNATGLAETRELLVGKGVKVVATQLDVSKRAEVFAWAERVQRAFNRCTMIFNNAGVAYASTAIEGEHDVFEHVMAVNFWGVVHGTQAFVPIIEASGGGHLVNISSLFGLIAFPGNSIYCASKFAVRGFTETLRLELEMRGSNVIATCVHPGGIKTGIARNARSHESLNALGISPKNGVSQMEQHFITTPEVAAATILEGVRRGKRRVLIGPDAAMMDLAQRMMPSSYAKYLGKAVQKRAKST